MTRTSRLPILLLVATIFSLVLTSTIGVSIFSGNALFVNEPLHSSIEAFGAMSAVLMALFLLQAKSEHDIREYSPLASGFLAMGILDGFHAVSVQGHAFIFFHSLASLAGGIGSALIWSRKFDRVTRSLKSLPWITAASASALGILVARYNQSLPAMERNGVFTPAAVWINIAAGILFILAAVFFLRVFSRTHKAESYLFFCLYLLLGLAELEFPLSQAWNENWWFWHVQRLAGYLVVLYFLLRTFHNNALEKEHLIHQLQDAFLEVRQLSGLLPICSSCKKIRDDEGQWKHLESFISEHSEAEFSHGLCPDCSNQAYNELNMLKKRVE